MTPSFVPAMPSDLDQLLQLMREYYEYDQLAFDREAASAALLELLQNPAYGRVWLIGAAPGEIAGYIALTFGYSLEFHGRDAFVDEFYLREAYRRKGIGSAALAFAAQFCAQHGISSVHLVVERHNHAARSFYPAQGYVNRDQTLYSLAVPPAAGKT